MKHLSESFWKCLMVTILCLLSICVSIFQFSFSSLPSALPSCAWVAHNSTVVHHQEGGQSHHNLLTLVIGPGVTSDPVRANQMRGASWCTGVGISNTHQCLVLLCFWTHRMVVLLCFLKVQQTTVLGLHQTDLWTPALEMIVWTVMDFDQSWNEFLICGNTENLGLLVCGRATKPSTP